MVKHHSEYYREERLSSWVLVFILTLLALFLFNLRPIADFDTGYHLKTGEYIFENHTVPLHDIFSFSAPNARWVAHYWFSDVLFFLWYKLAGFWGLILGVGLVAAISYLTVLKTAWLKTESRFLPLMLIVPYSALAFELWVVRPQIFSYLFVVLLIFLLEKTRLGDYQSRLLFFVPFIFLLWANMHAGIAIGLLILVLYCGASLVKNRFRFREKPIFLASFFSFLVIFLNPNGYKILTYSRDIAPVVRDINVLEWGSLLRFLGSWQAKVFFALMVVVLGFVLLRLLRRTKSFYEFDYISAGLMTGAFILPLISIRHVGFFPLLTFPLVVREIEHILKGRHLVFDRVNLMIPFAWFLTLVFLLGGIVRVPRGSVVNAHILPVGAVDFLQKHDIGGPMFNMPADGGYLIWQIWPKEKVFMDGRNEVYVGEPTDDLLTIARAQPGYEKLVNEKYNFNYFLLWYREPQYDLAKNLFYELTARGAFSLVYWDDAAIVLLRNGPENQEVLDHYAYRMIHPFFDPQQIPKELRPKVVEEIERAISISPDSEILKSLIK